MSIPFTFDASQVAPNSFEIVPAGWYNVIITDAEMAPTKKEGGQMLKMTLEVQDGPHKGRKLFDRLNLVNENPKAVEIAFRTLSSICHAINRIQIQDLEQIKGVPMLAKVKVTAPTQDYESSNEIKMYKACDGTPSCSDPSPTVSAAPPAASPAAGGWATPQAPAAPAQAPGGWAAPPAAAPAYAPPGPPAQQSWAQPPQAPPAAPPPQQTWQQPPPGAPTWAAPGAPPAPPQAAPPQQAWPTPSAPPGPPSAPPPGPGGLPAWAT